MALTITQVLSQFKADVATALSAETITHICNISKGHSLNIAVYIESLILPSEAHR